MDDDTLDLEEYRRQWRQKYGTGKPVKKLDDEEMVGDETVEYSRRLIPGKAIPVEEGLDMLRQQWHRQYGRGEYYAAPKAKIYSAEKIAHARNIIACHAEDLQMNGA
jgi:hypothetical protein